MRRRIISILVLISMLVSIAPLSVFATETPSVCYLNADSLTEDGGIATASFSTTRDDTTFAKYYYSSTEEVFVETEDLTGLMIVISGNAHVKMPESDFNTLDKLNFSLFVLGEGDLTVYNDDNNDLYCVQGIISDTPSTNINDIVNTIASEDNLSEYFYKITILNDYYPDYDFRCKELVIDEHGFLELHCFAEVDSLVLFDNMTIGDLTENCEYGLVVNNSLYISDGLTIRAYNNAFLVLGENVYDEHFTFDIDGSDNSFTLSEAHPMYRFVCLNNSWILSESDGFVDVQGCIKVNYPMNDGSCILLNDIELSNGQIYSYTTIAENGPTLELNLRFPEYIENPNNAVVVVYDSEGNSTIYHDISDTFSISTDDLNFAPIEVSIWFESDQYEYDTFEASDGEVIIEANSTGSGSFELASAYSASYTYNNCIKYSVSPDDSLIFNVIKDENQEGIYLARVSLFDTCEEYVYYYEDSIPGYNEETNTLTINEFVNGTSISFNFSDDMFWLEQAKFHFDSWRLDVTVNDVSISPDYQMALTDETTIKVTEIEHEGEYYACGFYGIVVRYYDGRDIYYRAEELTDNTLCLSPCGTSCDIELLVDPVPFTNEYYLEYSTIGGNSVTLNNEMIEPYSILPFSTEEPIVLGINNFATSEENPIVIIESHGDRVDVSDCIENNILTYYPESNDPIRIFVYWTQNENNFYNLTPGNNKYVLEFVSNGNGYAEISDEGTQPLEIYSLDGITRALFSCDEPFPSFNIIYTGEDSSLLGVMFENNYYDFSDLEGYDSDNNILSFDTSINESWTFLQFNFTGGIAEPEQHSINIEFPSDSVEVQYNGEIINPGRLNISDDCESITLSFVSLSSDQSHEGVRLEIRDSNGETEFRIIRASELDNGSLTIDTDFQDAYVEYMTNNSIFNNEFELAAEMYDNSNIDVNGTSINPGEAIEFTPGEELTFTLTPPEGISDVYSVLLDIPFKETINITGQISENVFSFTPDSEYPFRLLIVWSEEEYIYNNIGANYDQYVVDVESNGAGHVELSNDSTQPKNQASFRNRTRYVFDKNDPVPEFLFIPNNESVEILNVFIEGSDYSIDTLPGYNSETGVFSIENFKNDSISWLYFNVQYTGNSNHNLPWIDISFPSDCFEIQYNGDIVCPGRINILESVESITLSIASTNSDYSFYGIRLELHYSNGETEFRMIRASELDNDSITIDADFYEAYIDVFANNTIFNNEFELSAEMYDNSNIDVNGTSINPGEAIEFTTGEELTFTFTPPDGISNVYSVLLDIPYKYSIDVTEQISDNVFSYTPDSEYPFRLLITWSEEEYIFNNICQGEGQYIIDVNTNGAGHIELAEGSTQPINQASFRNRTRYLFSYEDALPEFLIVTDNNRAELVELQFDNDFYSADAIPGFNSDTGVLSINELILIDNYNTWYNINATFTGIDENSNKYHLNYDDSKFTVMLGDVVLEPFTDYEVEDTTISLSVFEKEEATLYGVIINSNYGDSSARIRADKLTDNVITYTHDGSYAEIRLLDYDEIFDGEFRYNSSNGNSTYVNGQEIESNTKSEFIVGEKLTFVFIPDNENDSIYAAEISYFNGSKTDITNLIENNQLVITMDTDSAFELHLWWSEESYIFDNTVPNEQESEVLFTINNCTIEFDRSYPTVSLNNSIKVFVPYEFMSITLTLTPNEGYKYSWGISNGAGFNENSYVINDDGTVTITIDKQFDSENLSVILVCEEDDSSILGDVDGNGKVTSADVNMMLKSISGCVSLDSAQSLAADVNQDGKVNSADVNMLIKYITGTAGL